MSSLWITVYNFLRAKNLSIFFLKTDLCSCIAIVGMHLTLFLHSYSYQRLNICYEAKVCSSFKLYVVTVVTHQLE